MGLRTKENLQKLFQASRERIQKKKEQLKQEKYKLNLQIQKVERAQLKSLLQQEKLKKMEQLQALAMKVSQKPLNEAIQPSKKLMTYHTTTIERFSAEEDLYTTREELMAAEERGEGKINWEKFDQLVKNFRERDNI